MDIYYIYIGFFQASNSLYVVNINYIIYSTVFPISYSSWILIPGSFGLEEGVASKEGRKDLFIYLE